MTNLPVTISAVGDISFQGRLAETPNSAVFKAVNGLLLRSDLAIGNLEGPLCAGGNPTPGKCTLRGSPAWAPVLKSLNFGLVSLANNHIMDFGPDGLRETLQALDIAGVAHVGAGSNSEEACTAKILSIKGKRIAFLARSSVPVSSLCFAGPQTPGVALLDEAETLAKLRRCRQEADIVVLIVHWGIEEYHFPTPEQLSLARRLQDAGAHLILGHHPHVLQGIHQNARGVVAFSLGNFLFDEFDWEIRLPEGPTQVLHSDLSPPNRHGMILHTSFEGNDSIRSIATHTRIAHGPGIQLDPNPQRKTDLQYLSRRLAHPLYKPWWRLYALRMEWRLRLAKQLSPAHILSNLHKLRPRHLVELAGLLKRSSRLTSGKSTNPYE
jgi:hypothetical protein